ncbi:MAG: sulfatase-like hydrolase/transferase, partial [candidate division Zixibacteria bacterium]|nr:sulfatase-like hydrolase/transferase [candidate division Zixibacteria bacterium]
MSNDRRPNVVVILTDQQRWDTAGAYGNPMNLTPNFDRLARNGTLFEHMFTSQPVCGPSRSCLQTGRYATTTGVFKNGLGLREDALTLGRLFRQGGYRTGYIGKWHLGGVNLGLYGGQEPVPEN